MPSSMLDLEKNCTYDVMNLIHLTWLVLLDYLVKVETPKMHVNTNSAFKVIWTKICAPSHNFVGIYLRN